MFLHHIPIESLETLFSKSATHMKCPQNHSVNVKGKGFVTLKNLPVYLMQCRRCCPFFGGFLSR